MFNKLFDFCWKLENYGKICTMSSSSLVGLSTHFALSHLDLCLLFDLGHPLVHICLLYTSDAADE